MTQREHDKFINRFRANVAEGLHRHLADGLTIYSACEEIAWQAFKQGREALVKRGEATTGGAT